MLRLRPDAGVSIMATWADAAAGAGVSRSASCAMKVPSPTRTAAKIIKLRITQRSTYGPRGRSHHQSRAMAINPVGYRRHFGEKDERSVNRARSAKNIGAQAPRGLTRRVGIALAGSSGQGWRG